MLVHEVAYASKTLTKSERGYSATRYEMLVLVGQSTIFIHIYMGEYLHCIQAMELCSGYRTRGSGGQVARKVD